MLKPICVKCQLFYRPFQTGYFFTEGMPTTNGTLPGLIEPEKWKPYKIWSGDIWECRGCGSQIIVGTGFQPIDYDYTPTFEENVKAFGADKFQVNDC